MNGAAASGGDAGYFVDSDDECEVEQVTENPARYHEALLYPIQIGETIADRYRIEHKLGHGGFSAVWMAYDIHDRMSVALKIMTPGEAAEREFSVQDELRRALRDTRHFLLYTNAFLLDGPGMKYRVLVLPLQGPCLRGHVLRARVMTRMSAAKQLLQSLKSLHDAGFVHRGKKRSSRLQVAWITKIQGRSEYGQRTIRASPPRRPEHI